MEVVAKNPRRDRARVVRDMEELIKQGAGTLWRESPISPSTVGRDGGNPPYVMATGSGNRETAYVVFALDDGSRYLNPDEHGIFLPSEHQPTFPLTEVVDGTTLVIGNDQRSGE